jgi:hypothetical protein
MVYTSAFKLRQLNKILATMNDEQQISIFKRTAVHETLKELTVRL